MGSKLRNSITWRLTEPQQHEKLNRWLDAQKNNQESITNIVLHMIERFGYTDITDFDVQRVLFDFASSTNDQSNNQFLSNDSENETIKQKEQKKDVNNEDDIFNNVDPNNL